jgi:hypothetical protein
MDMPRRLRPRTTHGSVLRNNSSSPLGMSVFVNRPWNRPEIMLPTGMLWFGLTDRGAAGVLKEPASRNSSEVRRTRLPVETQLAPRTGQQGGRRHVARSPAAIATPTALCGQGLLPYASRFADSLAAPAGFGPAIIPSSGEHH